MDLETPTDEQIARLEEEVAQAERQLDVAKRSIQAMLVETSAVASAGQIHHSWASPTALESRRREGSAGVSGFMLGALAGSIFCGVVRGVLHLIGLK